MDQLDQHVVVGLRKAQLVEQQPIKLSERFDSASMKTQSLVRLCVKIA